MSHASRSIRSSVVTAVLAVLVVTTAVSAPAVAASPPATDATSEPATAETPPTAAATATQSTNTLTFTHTFERLPERDGLVRVTVETAAPASVTGVSLAVPDEATVVGTTGYEQTTAETWTWDRSGDVDRPTLTYVVPVDRSDDGTLEATSTGDWALFNWRTVDVGWRYSRDADAPEPTVVKRGEPAAEGVVGPGYAYLGPYETETRMVDGETIRLVVPAAAEMEASPAAVADALAGASANLHVGARNDRLTVFVAPEPIDAAGRLSRAEVDGRQDMYVGADQPLDTADNAWFHEYVHSRQSYDVGPGMDWFDDASAEYYAALLAYEGGHVSKGALYDYLRTDDAQDAVLAESESVDDSASYFKGMRVLAALDAEIRDASDGERTLADVFAATNAHETAVGYDAFVTLVAETAGESREAWLDRYVGSDATPTVPDYLDGQSQTPLSATTGPQRGSQPISLLGALFFVGGVVVAGAVLARRT